MLSIVSCSYRYPGAGHWAFKDIDFSIAPGEIVFLRGRNGSGKSTLLKVISGILQPTEGIVRSDVGTHPTYMDQSAHEMLALDLTVGEHLSAFNLDSILSLKSAHLLHAFGVGLDTRLDEFVGHLSGGQRQIVALLATIESGANLLCLDEFLSALDSRSVEVATNLIDQVVKNKFVSVIAVSHLPVDLRVDREIKLDSTP